MKKWLTAAILALFLLALLPFEREGEPGGTRSLGAVIWKAVWWEDAEEAELYWFPDSLQTIDNLIKIKEQP